MIPLLIIVMSVGVWLIKKESLTAGLLCYPAFLEGALCHRRVTHFSGNANQGTDAGAFLWNLNNDSSNDNRNIGGRLTVAAIVEVQAPHPLVEYVAIKA